MMSAHVAKPRYLAFVSADVYVRELGAFVESDVFEQSRAAVAWCRRLARDCLARQSQCLFGNIVGAIAYWIG